MNLIDMEPGWRHLCPSSVCMDRLYGSLSLSLRSSVPFLSPLTSFVYSSKQRSRHHSPSRPEFLILCAKAWSPRIKRTYRRWLLVERGGMEGPYGEEWSPHNINPDNWLSVIRGSRRDCSLNSGVRDAGREADTTASYSTGDDVMKL
jgi:hypothetical protein